MTADIPSGPMPPPPKRPRVILVTGPSGAGRTTAIRALEDLSYEAIDNLPLSLMDRLLEGQVHPLALGVDVRTRDFSVARLLQAVDTLNARPDIEGELLYLDCRADVLLRRFSETRRRHPMAPDETPQLGVERELDLLAPVRARADHLIDTSDLTLHDLRAALDQTFAPKSGGGLAVSIQSFSYKRGVPQGVDMVFDCRFLRNPYWSPELRALTGQDGPVGDYIVQDARFDAFLSQVNSMCELLLPAFRDEGKTHLVIAFGCTGGQHRSVYLTERLAEGLAEVGWQVSKRHRELDRGAIPSGAQTLNRTKA